MRDARCISVGNSVGSIRDAGLVRLRGKLSEVIDSANACQSAHSELKSLYEIMSPLPLTS
jgi:3-methyladenine DNA glycosylase Tag